jgi:predicted dehydrogenase
VGSEPRRGERIQVEVPTHVEGLLRFASGALVSLTASWDVWPVDRYRLELFGTEGTIHMPDPNFVGGVAQLRRDDEAWQTLDSRERPYAEPNRDSKLGPPVADYRIIGVVDMAEAIRDGRPHRASDSLACHVLEVLEALGTAALEQKEVPIVSRCERPVPLTEAFDSA